MSRLKKAALSSAQIIIEGKERWGPGQALIMAEYITKQEELEERSVVLTHEDFDMVWEILVESANAMKYGKLNACEGTLGNGPELPEVTKELKGKLRKVVGQMAKFVATEEKPVKLKLK